MVKVAAPAAQDPRASSVAAFLGRYFTAINSHDYYAYRTLYVPQVRQGMTRAKFHSGYWGTFDSGVRLVGISTAGNDDTQAVLAFTSHQHPDAANSYETCTKWQISLFLAQGVNGYLIDVPPPGYHAASAACP